PRFLSSVFSWWHRPGVIILANRNPYLRARSPKEAARHSMPSNPIDGTWLPVFGSCRGCVSRLATCVPRSVALLSAELALLSAEEALLSAFLARSCACCA